MDLEADYSLEKNLTAPPPFTNGEIQKVVCGVGKKVTAYLHP